MTTIITREISGLNAVPKNSALTNAEMDNNLISLNNNKIEASGVTTDNAIARFDGTTGKIVQDSGVTIDDNKYVFINCAPTAVAIGSPGGMSIASGNFGCHGSSAIGFSLGYVLGSLSYLGWSSDQFGTFATGPYIYRDTSTTLAQRNGTNAQTSRLYSTYTSATSYHRMAMTCAKQTLSSVSGATVTTTGGLIPAGAFLMGVTTRINTTLGITNSTSGFTVGTTTDPNLWGNVTAITAGTASKASPITNESSGYTANDACGLQLTAQDITLTATGGNFDGTGVIEISAFYFLAEAD